MEKFNTIQTELLKVKELVYDTCNFEVSDSINESESLEYQASTFKINSNQVIHRVSKITPTKIGQFVTIWKRDDNGITTPFDFSDAFDFIVITSRSEENLGQFVFPKSVLVEKGIINNSNNTGKRGIRVYPSWDIPMNKQAIKTQNWQTKYFYSINDESFDIDLVKKMFSIKST